MHSHTQLIFGAWPQRSGIYLAWVYYSQATSSEDEVICQHVDVLGPMPKHWWECWKNRSEFFDRNGLPRDDRDVWPSIERIFEQYVQTFRREDAMGGIWGGGKSSYSGPHAPHAELPAEVRPTIREVLQSEWMVKWVMPDLERCRAPSSVRSRE